MSYTGKYALAKHETLALKCEDLQRQLDEAKKALAIVYDPICDINFIVENELKKNILTEVGKSMLIDANDKIMQGAKESEWFKKQLKEKGDE